MKNHEHKLLGRIKLSESIKVEDDNLYGLGKLITKKGNVILGQFNHDEVVGTIT